MLLTVLLASGFVITTAVSLYQHHRHSRMMSGVQRELYRMSLEADYWKRRWEDASEAVDLASLDYE